MQAQIAPEQKCDVLTLQITINAVQPYNELYHYYDHKIII